MPSDNSWNVPLPSSKFPFPLVWTHCSTTTALQGIPSCGIAWWVCNEDKGNDTCGDQYGCQGKSLPLKHSSCPNIMTTFCQFLKIRQYSNWQRCGTRNGDVPGCHQSSNHQQCLHHHHHHYKLNTLAQHIKYNESSTGIGPSLSLQKLGEDPLHPQNTPVSHCNFVLQQQQKLCQVLWSGIANLVDVFVMWGRR